MRENSIKSLTAPQECSLRSATGEHDCIAICGSVLADQTIYERRLLTRRLSNPIQGVCNHGLHQRLIEFYAQFSTEFNVTSG